MHHSQSPSRRHFTLLAVTFETLLGLLALALTWLCGLRPSAVLDITSAGTWLGDLLWGLATALPLFAALVLADLRPVGMLRQLQRTVRQEVVPLFQHTSLGGLAAISVAAGVGEELLFRGFLQGSLGQWLSGQSGVGDVGSAAVALLLASAVFGACHWLCTAYALVATLMGLVLGGLFLATDGLAAPIAAHALYDFLALVYLVRGPASNTSPGGYGAAPHAPSPTDPPPEVAPPDVPPAEVTSPEVTAPEPRD